MHKVMQEIERLRYSISMEAFSNDCDYSRIRKLENKIKELYKEVPDGFVVKFITDHVMYLTSDERQCFCDEPTVFESVDEAVRYLSKAAISNYNYEICKYKYDDTIKHPCGDCAYYGDCKELPEECEYADEGGEN